MADVNGKSDGLSANSQSGTALTRADAASRVLENLAELEPELVNAGIFDHNRELVAATSGSPAWPKQAATLLEALESGSGEEDFDSAHIASASGEVFAVSESGLSLVAVTGRFVLASLASYDMRMALRDVARVGAGEESSKSSSEAENMESEDA